MDDTRPKRRCAARHAVNRAMPSAIHYVGYVEDDETPEMIMRKFEELEKIKQQQPVGKDGMVQPTDALQAAVAETQLPDGCSGAPDDVTGCNAADMTAPITAAAATYKHDLTDDQLLQVFKQTSMFNVRTALQNNEVLLDSFAAEGGGYSEDDLFSDDEGNADYLAGFWSDEDGTSYAQHWRELRKKRTDGQRVKQAGGDRGAVGRTRHVMHYNAASQAFIRRKVRMVDEDAIVQLRIPPPPLSLAWGRNVQPYVPKHLYGTEAYLPTVRGDTEGAAEAGHGTTGPTGASGTCCGYSEIACIHDIPASELQQGGRYLGVLINPGWEAKSQSGQANDDAHTVRHLAALQLHCICPTGFIFIWVDKQQISAVMDLMYEHKFVYVENLNWLQLGPNNKLLALESQYFARSHLTLFIFRRDGGGKHIELRHQRNPDVILDCVRGAEGGTPGIPPETYIMIETLLPTGRGHLLELWAQQGYRRPGWTHYVQLASANAQTGNTETH